MNGMRVCAAPGSWAMRGDPRYLKHLCTTPTGEQHRTPVLVLVTEAKDYDMDKALRSVDLHDWNGLQRTSSQARMGCAMAVHKSVDILDWGQELGAAPFIAGRRVRMLSRYITWLRARYDSEHYFAEAIHDPPKRFKPLQTPYDHAIRATSAGHPHAFVAGDFNGDIRVKAKQLGMKVGGGRGITGILVRRQMRANDVVVQRWGINEHIVDHPSTSLTVLP
jgi:hypothetical protein